MAAGVVIRGNMSKNEGEMIKLEIPSFHVGVLQRTGSKCIKIHSARAELLSRSLLFCDILVDVAIVSLGL